MEGKEGNIHFVPSVPFEFYMMWICETHKKCENQEQIVGLQFLLTKVVNSKFGD